MIKCCIFDLDGTLLDTISTITYYVNKTFKEEGIDQITENECKYFAGNGAELLISRSLASKNYHNPEDVSRILAKYKENYDAEPLYLTEPFEGIKEMLFALKERGVKCAVISNKQHEATVPVVYSFFGDLIATARGGKEGVPLKPAPDAIYEMMKELGVSAEEVAYIGDTNVDMQTGRAFAAAKTIGVTWGFREREELLENGADVIVSKPEEILAEVLQ